MATTAPIRSASAASDARRPVPWRSNWSAVSPPAKNIRAQKATGRSAAMVITIASIIIPAHSTMLLPNRQTTTKKIA